MYINQSPQPDFGYIRYSNPLLRGKYEKLIKFFGAHFLLIIFENCLRGLVAAENLTMRESVFGIHMRSYIVKAKRRI